MLSQPQQANCIRTTMCFVKRRARVPEFLPDIVRTLWANAPQSGLAPTPGQAGAAQPPAGSATTASPDGGPAGSGATKAVETGVSSRDLSTPGSQTTERQRLRPHPARGSKGAAQSAAKAGTNSGSERGAKKGTDKGAGHR